MRKITRFLASLLCVAMLLGEAPITSFAAEQGMNTEIVAETENETESESETETKTESETEAKTEAETEEPDTPDSEQDPSDAAKSSDGSEADDPASEDQNPGKNGEDTKAEDGKSEENTSGKNAEIDYSEILSGTDMEELLKNSGCEGFAHYAPGEEGFMDNDQMAQGYIDRLFGIEDDLPLGGSTLGQQGLSGQNLRTYNCLRPFMERVAYGYESESVYSCPISYITGGSGSISVSWSAVMNALLVDIPYEMFWYDKTRGMNCSWGGGTITFYFCTAYEYAASAGGNQYYLYKLDKTKLSSARTAVANAQSVVSTAMSSGLSDFKKMLYYKEWICQNNSYNYAAVYNNWSYGNPWQLVYVFDGDSSTNVVCEGYSKAFMYLCEQTTFNDPSIYAITVVGDMSTSPTGSGAHMWNIVHMDDGLNYMVDVTNCDSDYIPKGSETLFMKAPVSGSVNTSDPYLFSNGYYYRYRDKSSESVYSIYGTSQLVLAPEDYVDGPRCLVRLDGSDSDNGGGWTKSVAYGSYYGNMPTPIRTGYDFVGWYTSKVGGTKILSSSKVPEQESITLYAHWTAKKYDLTLDAGEGDLPGGKTRTTQGTYDSTLSSIFAESASKATRTGYTFAGWFTSPQGGEKIESASVWKWTEAVTLYAHWTANPYTLTLVANGGAFPAGQSGKETVTFDSAYGSAVTTQIPTRKGYTFVGWFTATIGGEQVTENSIVKTAANHKVYARWEANTYTVTLHPSGGIITNGKVTVDYDSPYGTLGTPTKKGYVFKGWYSDSALENKVNPEDTVLRDEDHTLYAKWDVELHSVTFHAGNGQFAGGTKTMAVDDIAYGTAVGEDGFPDNPELTGSVFAGWYTEVNGKGQKFTAQTKTEENITVYAHYIAAEAQELWVGPLGSFTYTGKAICPEPDVYCGSVKLIKGVDYAVSYRNNVAAADQNSAKAPQIIISTKGSYSGRATASFVIEPKDLGDSDVQIVTGLVTYNGKVQTPSVTVTMSGRKVPATGYRLVDENGVKASVKAEGKYLFFLEGTGNFTGSVPVNVDVVSKTRQISTATVTIKDAEYNNLMAGSADGILPTLLQVKVGTKILTEGVDYFVTYENNRKAGTATAIISGTEVGDAGYVGSKRVNYKIKGLSIGAASVALGYDAALYGKGASLSDCGNNGTYTYTGSEIEPVVTVTYRGTPLTAGDDYVVSYEKNVGAGTGVVTITGTGAYTGAVRKSFRINPLDLRGVSCQVSFTGGTVRPDGRPAFTYEVGGVYPECTVTVQNAAGEVLTLGAGDYTSAYANNQKVCDYGSGAKKLPTVTVRGKGNYKNNIETPFYIATSNFEGVTISAPDVVYKNRKGNYKSTPVLTTANGKRLVAGKDYEKTYQYYQVKSGGNALLTDASIIPAKSKILVTVTGKGAYEGAQISGAYYIGSTAISSGAIKATVSDVPAYAGRAVELLGSTEYGKSSNSAKRAYSGKLTLKDKSGNLITQVGTARSTDSKAPYSAGIEILTDTYVANTKAGTASVMIRGVGSYCGTMKITFRIPVRNINFK